MITRETPDTCCDEHEVCPECDVVVMHGGAATSICDNEAYHDDCFTAHIGSCFECADYHRPEPEWDKDAYYERKYGLDTY